MPPKIIADRRGSVLLWKIHRVRYTLFGKIEHASHTCMIIAQRFKKPSETGKSPAEHYIVLISQLINHTIDQTISPGLGVKKMKAFLT